MPKYDIKQVPRELLEEYASYCLGIKPGREVVPESELGAKVAKAATVKLRTKSEVDAEIASAVRQYAEWWKAVEHSKPENLDFSGTYGEAPRYLYSVFVELLLEETE